MNLLSPFQFHIALVSTLRGNITAWERERKISLSGPFWTSQYNNNNKMKWLFFEYAFIQTTHISHFNFWEEMMMIMGDGLLILISFLIWIPLKEACYSSSRSRNSNNPNARRREIRKLLPVNYYFPYLSAI